ncbi:MAG: preprotein translocase subunit SecG [Desulfovibrionaceae bacterium]
MDTVILILHIVVCVLLVVVILLQSGHEGMGVIFGGGSSTMFGSTGAGGFLTKLTAGLAALFLLTSLGYNLLTSNARTTDLTRVLEQTAASAPAPAAPEGPATEAQPAPQSGESQPSN